MASVPDLYVGKEPATFEFDGSPVFIGPSIVVRAGHPILEGREGLFTPLTVHYDVPQPEPAGVSQAPPPQNAPKGEWVAYVESCGGSRAGAEALSKEQLVGLFGRR